MFVAGLVDFYVFALSLYLDLELLKRSCSSSGRFVCLFLSDFTKQTFLDDKFATSQNQKTKDDKT